MPPVTYRDLTTLEDFAAVVDLEREIWGPGYDEVVPVPILAVTVMRGGILIGAFDPIEEHWVDGFVDGFIAGLVGAGLFGFVAARLHAWLMWLKGPQVADHSDAPSRLQDVLAPTLAELEAVRLDAGRRIRRRARWMTPVGAGALLAAWAIYAVLNRDLDLLLPPAAVCVGALAGHIVAVGRQTNNLRIYWNEGVKK